MSPPNQPSPPKLSEDESTITQADLVPESQDVVEAEGKTAQVKEGNELASEGSNNDAKTAEVAGQAPEIDQGEAQAPEVEQHNESLKDDQRESPKTSKEESPAQEEVKDSPESKAAAAPEDPVDQIMHKTKDVLLSSTPPRKTSPDKAPVRSPTPPPPPPKDDKFLGTSQDAPPRTPSPSDQMPYRKSEDGDAAEYEPKYVSGEDNIDDSRSEIQSIMEQFDHGDGGTGPDEIMSPRMELAGPMLESPMSHPPRKSSLEPLNSRALTEHGDSGPSNEQSFQSPPPRTSSLYRVGTNTSMNTEKTPGSPKPQSILNKPTPPAPDPEPDLPFDFHRFLEQLRHRTADPVAKFLRSFLLEFGKKQWMVHEQVKIISDFLEFISKKMAQCEVWRTVSDAEFDNAREGMEKLVMNRLYSQTFSPAIPPPEPAQRKGRRGGHEPTGFGRRGQHQEDVERDEVLAQKVRIYKWIKEEHLDIKPVGDKGRKFLGLAQQELLKIKSYRAPRDKVICVLNCCKVIFGFLRTSQSDQSADAFVPLLIYTVLQANPDHLVSNVQYILRFRNQDKLGGEAGYYISSLMGAIQFVENLDRTSLTVTDAEFEENVEAAVSAIAERHSPSPPPEPSDRLQAPSSSQGTPAQRRMPSPHMHVSEKSALSRPEVTPRNSLDAERIHPRRSTSEKGGEMPEEENAAVAGLLRTMKRPLSTIGRIFSDTDTSTSGPTSSPQAGTTPSRLSPAPPLPRRSTEAPPQRSPHSPNFPPGVVAEGEKQRQKERQRLSAEESAARQASAEAEEARKIQVKEHRVVVETLQGMFPGLDREVIDDVVRLKEGRVGLAVDACLALSNP